MTRRALAAAAFLSAILSFPVHADSLQEVQALIRQGQHAQALEKADRFLASKPRDAQMRFLKGVALSEMNRPSEAIYVFQKLSEDYPELPEPYNNLAVLYAQQRQYEKARNALEMAIRTHPSYATAHENLGDVYARLASQAYDKALQLDSSNVGAQNKLALIRDLITLSGRQAKPGTPIPAAPVAATPVAAKPAPAPAPVAAAPAPVPPVALAKPTPVAPAPKPPVVTKEESKPAASSPAKEEPAATGDISRALQAWAAAWSRKDVKSYLTHYARDFDTPGGMPRKAWESEREQRLNKPGKIDVDLENIHVVSVTGDRATVKFRQHYRSSNLNSSSTKTVTMEKHDGRWLIKQERVGG